MGSEESMRVVVAYSPAVRQVLEVALDLPIGCTVQQALQASGMAVRFPGLDLGKASVGVWGRRVSLDHVLRTADRVEIYRPLRVDPKVARRERFAKQGARTAGLFAKQRPNAKAGY